MPPQVSAPRSYPGLLQSAQSSNRPRGCVSGLPAGRELVQGALTIDEVEVLPQEAGVHGDLVELQLRLGVVVHRVDTHLQHPKAALQVGEDPSVPGRATQTLPSSSFRHIHVFTVPIGLFPAPCQACSEEQSP